MPAPKAHATTPKHRSPKDRHKLALKRQSSERIGRAPSAESAPGAWDAALMICICNS